MTVLLSPQFPFFPCTVFCNLKHFLPIMADFVLGESCSKDSGGTTLQKTLSFMRRPFSVIFIMPLGSRLLFYYYYYIFYWEVFFSSKTFFDSTLKTLFSLVPKYLYYAHYLRFWLSLGNQSILSEHQQHIPHDPHLRNRVRFLGALYSLVYVSIFPIINTYFNVLLQLGWSKDTGRTSLQAEITFLLHQLVQL